MHPSPTIKRLLGACALAIAELLLLSVLFDTRALHARGSSFAWLGYTGDLATVALVAVAAAFGLNWPRLRSALVAAPEGAETRVGLVSAVHALAFGALLGASAHVLDPARTTDDPAWIAVWLLSIAGTAASWLRIAMRVDVLVAVGPRLAAAFALGLLVGVLTWSWGQVSMRAWRWVAPATVELAFSLLHALSSDAMMIPEEAVIGLAGFEVVVSPLCSGLEGVGLITAFVACYVAIERDQLRVGRALALIPVAIVASYVLNVVRIVLLILVGAYVSPGVALGGFHSKAGWLFFCALALGFVALLRGASFFHREARADHEAADAPNEAAPYLVPLLVVIATGLLTGVFAASAIDHAYGLRVLVGGFALYLFRGRLGLRLQPRVDSIALGAGVFLVWLVLAQPGDAGLMRQALTAWSPAVATLWVASRVVGSVVIAPLVEELAFRGYVLRRLMGADIESADVRHVHVLAWIGSSVAFGLLHGDWLAGIAAGFAFAWAQQRRGELGDAVIAHATANALLVLDAWLRGQLGWLA